MSWNIAHVTVTKTKKKRRFVCSRGFPGGSGVKNPPVNAGEVDLILGSGRSPGEENGDLFQYSFLRNPMDMTEQLSTHTHSSNRNYNNSWSLRVLIAYSMLDTDHALI